MYSFQSRVRYSEINENRELDLYSILNYFQDCSNFHSVDIGVGLEYLTARNRAWLLSSWQVEIVEPPKLFDHIEIATWPYDFKGLYGYRNFVLYNEEKNHSVAAYANSIWFLVDTETMRPIRITPEDSAAYVNEPPYPMDYAARKIALPTEQVQTSKMEPISVNASMLDTNRHVNNAQYIRLAAACIDPSFPIRKMRAEYRHSAVAGDIICPIVMTCEDPKLCYVSLQDPEGNVYALIEFSSEAPKPSTAE